MLYSIIVNVLILLGAKIAQFENYVKLSSKFMLLDHVLNSCDQHVLY